MGTKSEVTLDNLHTIIRNAKNPEIQNLHQLCGKLFGKKRCTWLAFERLMRWLKYTGRDGIVYKSSRELAFEINCSQKTIDRSVPALIEVGFDVYLRKANGAPTRHFVLDEKRLVESVAKAFGLGVMDTRMLMELGSPEDYADFKDDFHAASEQVVTSRTYAQKVPDTDISSNSFSGMSPDEISSNVQKEMGKMSKSLTRTSYKKDIPIEHQGFSSFLQSTEAMKWCRELDTKPETVTAWVKAYGFEMVHGTILEARAKKEQGKIHKSMFGWVQTALRAKHKVKHLNNW